MLTASTDVASLLDAKTGTDADQLHSSVRLVRSFIAILSFAPCGSLSASPRLQRLPGWDSTHVISRDGAAELAFVDAEPCGRTIPGPAGRVTLIVGDDAEWEESQGKMCMGNAACLEWDAMQGSISVLSSIVAMPPIFVCRTPGFVVVTSELYLLRAVAQLPLAINPQSALELFAFGYPLGHRTLFTGVTLMPGAHRLQLDVHGGDHLTRSWNPPQPEPLSEPSSSVALQAEAFRRAVTNLHLTNSLFALTGGLDTRAVLAVLSKTAARPTACTMSGSPAVCLDARLAMALCREYRWEHVLVTLGEQYVRDLPAYVVEASRLSGGLASLDQAHDVYFNRQLNGVGSRRLSGNLGNQLARRGLEAYATRDAAFAVLNEGHSRAASVQRQQHWLDSATRNSQSTLLQLLLECEAPFSSVGNFSIGQHFMIQQTPYANRLLIETALRSPVHAGASRRFKARQARLRHVGRRFFGQARAHSFQCSVIRAVGGAAAHYPINWGWRAAGGISLRGLGWGVLSFADAASTTCYASSAMIRKVLSAVGASGLEEIRQSRLWLDTVLREFVNDTLRSKPVAESGLFSAAALGRVLDEHYDGVNSHHTTIVATLDLALAHQIFVAL